MRLLICAVTIAASWALYLILKSSSLAATTTPLRQHHPRKRPARTFAKPAPTLFVEEPVALPAIEAAPVHVVFSTDCSGYQDWQSEVVFNSALVVGQEGPLTRIASGCDRAQEQRLRDRYAKLYGPLFGSQIFLHVTPVFDKAESGKTYKFFNKPRGIEHWLESPQSNLTDIVALIDPDFAFLRRLSDKLESPLVIKPWTRDELPKRVERGRPVAQQYGLGTHWRTFDRKKICGDNSPCLDTSDSDAYKYYPVGPPYLLHVDDWRRIAPVWTRFAPRVYDQYPELLAEMYAYCMAAAHLRLRHVRVNHMMLSNAAVKDEGWTLIDAMPVDAACRGRPSVVGPTFLHYCQNYRLGDWMFAKRRVPPQIMTDCGHPDLAMPPATAWQIDYELHPPGNPCKSDAQRASFLVGLLIRRRQASQNKRENSQSHQPRRLPRDVRASLARTGSRRRRWHTNAAAHRARDVFCDAALPRPPSSTAASSSFASSHAPCLGLPNSSTWRCAATKSHRHDLLLKFERAPILLSLLWKCPTLTLGRHGSFILFDGRAVGRGDAQAAVRVLRTEQPCERAQRRTDRPGVRGTRGGAVGTVVAEVRRQRRP